MYTTIDGIAEITIDGGPANLLTVTILTGLECSLRAADADPDVTGVVLSGSATVFCGGLDIASIATPADSVALAAALVSLLKLFPALSKPVAASVVGDALASGASLVCACDYAASGPDVSIGTVEASKGIWPMVAQVPIIHRLGARAALENLGSGVPFTARRAYELGIVNVITDDPDAAARAWLRDAARGGAAARAGRPFAYALAELDYDDALDAALGRFSSMFSTD